MHKSRCGEAAVAVVCTGSRVDLDEVRDRVRGADHGGIRLRHVEKRMG